VPDQSPTRSDSAAVRSGGPEIHSLTAVRGIAAWWVVFFHFDTYLRPYLPSPVYYVISKGYLAVDLFFCLSGFVIFLNYGTLNTGSSRELFNFYLRRIAKIYPLHIFTICLYGLLVIVLMLTHRDPTSRFSGLSLLLNLFLVQDWAILHGLTWNVPSWSISAEFAAYLLFPGAVLLVRFVGGRVAFGFMVFFSLLFLLNFFYASQDFRIGSAIETLGVARAATQFAIGALLADFFLRAPSASRLSQASLLVLAALFLCAGLNVLESLLIPTAWACLVFAIAHGDRKRDFLNHRWLVFIGHVSYATYMIHYFVRDIFKLALVHADETVPLHYVLGIFLVIFAASVPLYLYIERPAQRYLTRKTRSQRASA